MPGMVRWIGYAIVIVPERILSLSHLGRLMERFPVPRPSLS
uniref:Uncharacterized protein n=1 Tax=Anopheles christyi TaxID=43041 RepID=A0A182KCK5_9DIPT